MGFPRTSTIAALAAISMVTGCTHSNYYIPYPGGHSSAQTLYVGNCGNGSITEYPASASGNVAPTVTISGSNTGLTCPYGLSVDSSGNLYVADYGAGTVSVFAKGASGNVAPTRTLTGLADPLHAIADAQGNLYVSSITTPDIYVYAPGANGNAPTPERTIDLAGIGFQRTCYLAFDNAGNIWASDERNNVVADVPENTSGAATAVRKITGSNTAQSGSYGVAVDKQGDLYLANYGNPSVNVYGPAVNGNEAPTAELTGGLTTLNIPYVPAIRSADGAIVVDDASANSIDFFAKNSNGGVAPEATISGSNTGISEPWGMTIH